MDIIILLFLVIFSLFIIIVIVYFISQGLTLGQSLNLIFRIFAVAGILCGIAYLISSVIARSPLWLNRDTTRPEKEPTERCLFCGKENMLGRVFCISCGEELPKTEFRIKKDEVRDFCPFCKKKIYPGRAFCLSCGKRLPDKVIKRLKKTARILGKLRGE